jgi:hypothetical protein
MLRPLTARDEVVETVAAWRARWLPCADAEQDYVDMFLRSFLADA